MGCAAQGLDAFSGSIGVAGKDWPTTPAWQRDGIGKQIRQVLDSMAPQLEAAYETNWCLWVWRSADGTIKHDVGEYECGY